MESEFGSVNEVKPKIEQQEGLDDAGKVFGGGSANLLGKKLFRSASTNTASKVPNESLPKERIFKVPNVEKAIEEGKKIPGKYRNITLHSVGINLPVEIYTATGWSSVSGHALKTLAGKISAEYDFIDEANDLLLEDDAL